MKGLPELGSFKVYFVGNTESLKQESHMPIFALKTKRKLLRNPVVCGLKVPILESGEWPEGGTSAQTSKRCVTQVYQKIADKAHQLS